MHSPTISGDSSGKATSALVVLMVNLGRPLEGGLRKFGHDGEEKRR
jgi:hypothetical protein